MERDVQEKRSLPSSDAKNVQPEMLECAPMCFGTAPLVDAERKMVGSSRSKNDRNVSLDSLLSRRAEKQVEDKEKNDRVLASVDEFTGLEDKEESGSSSSAGEVPRLRRPDKNVPRGTHDPMLDSTTCVKKQMEESAYVGAAR
jgi:hypothetical protein